MEILRIVGATVVAGWFCWFLGKTVLDGLRTGSIRHTDTATTCRRDRNPLLFWFLVVFFSAIVLGFVNEWIFIVTDAVRRLKQQ